MRAPFLLASVAAAALAGAAGAETAVVEPFAFECPGPEAAGSAEISGFSVADIAPNRRRCLDEVRIRIDRCWDGADPFGLPEGRSPSPCTPFVAGRTDGCVAHFLRQAERCNAGRAEPDAGDWREVQRSLARAGTDPGPADGVAGPRTRKALAAWQSANGYDASGEPTGEQLLRLLSRDAAAVRYAVRGCKLFDVKIGGHTNDFRLCAYTDESAWTGLCIDGKAAGRGAARVEWECDRQVEFFSNYLGEALEGERHGRGILTDSDGMWVEGEWRGGKAWNAEGLDWYGRRVEYVLGERRWDP